MSYIARPDAQDDTETALLSSLDGLTVSSNIEFLRKATATTIINASLTSLDSSITITGSPTSIDLSANPRGLVVIIHKDGTRTAYDPLADTDVARGTALMTAFNAAVSNDSIYLTGHTFDIGLDSYFDMPTGVTLRGSNMYTTVIKTDSSYSPILPYAILNVNDDILIRDLTVWGTNAAGKFHYPIGNGNSTTHGGSRVRLINVKIIADTDGLMFDNGLHVDIVGHNVIIESKWDAVNLQSGDFSSITLYDSTITVAGPSSTGTGIVRGVRCADDNNIYLYNTNVTATDGGVESSPGVYTGYTVGIQNVSPGSSINLYGGSVTVSSTLDAFTDLYSLQVGDGEIAIDSQTRYATTLVFGTPTYSNATENRKNIENSLSALTGMLKVTAGVFSITPTFSGTSPIVVNGGTGAISFDFSTNNTWTGTNFYAASSTALVKMNKTATGGRITTVALGVTAAGTGYAVGDTFNIVQSGASGGTGRVLSIGGGGTVTGALVLANGSGYTVASGLATTNIIGTGSGLTVSIGGVSLSDFFYDSTNGGFNFGQATTQSTSVFMSVNAPHVAQGLSFSRTVTDPTKVGADLVFSTTYQSKGTTSATLRSMQATVSDRREVTTGTTDTASNIFFSFSRPATFSNTASMNTYTINSALFQQSDLGVYTSTSAKNVTHRGFASTITFQPTINTGTTWNEQLTGVDTLITFNPTLTSGTLGAFMFGTRNQFTITNTGTNSAIGYYTNPVGSDDDIGIFLDTEGWSYMGGDNAKTYWGTGGNTIGQCLSNLAFLPGDASIYYDGTNLVVNPQEIGAGNLTLAAGSVDSFVGYQVQGNAGLGTVAVPLVINTAQLTALGAQGTMTFIGGILTAQVQAT